MFDRPMYYDWSGRPLAGPEEWMSLRTEHGRHVAKSYFTVKGHDFFVSTVWLGLDHSFMDGPPLIFETMAFPDDGGFSEIFMDRYSTAHQAAMGHVRIVRKTKKWARAEYKRPAKTGRQLINNGGKP